MLPCAHDPADFGVKNVPFGYGVGLLLTGGYNDALRAAMPIAADADALVEELIEWIEDVLYGRQGLTKWAADAEAMLARLKHRRQ